MVDERMIKVEDIIDINDFSSKWDNEWEELVNKHKYLKNQMTN